MVQVSVIDHRDVGVGRVDPRLTWVAVGTGRGDQFRGDFQKLFDEGIQIALKLLGE